MKSRERAAREGIRFVAEVASDPSGVIALWKAAGGGKVVGCLPATPVPEIPHAAGLMPIPFGSTGDLSLLSGQVDAWLIGQDPALLPVPPGENPRFAFPRAAPRDIEEALDRIEAFTEWAGSVSGSRASEGALWKSIGVHATLRSLLDALGRRAAADRSFLTDEERRDIARAGTFLPPETISRVLSSILGLDPDPVLLRAEGEKGDPLLLLAKRLL